MQHIGFIMDGNRRWAKKMSNIVTSGHEAGSKTLERVISLCLDKEIPYVSMWALSRENITERAELEIRAIYSIIRSNMPQLIDMFLEKGIRFETVWDMTILPPDIQNIIQDAKAKTLLWTRMTFILAIAYSGQDEIIRWIKEWVASRGYMEQLDEQKFLTFLDSGKFPPPDLIVRTGWNIRHSGYFLYQSAYSEYFFTETLWPDFNKKDLEEACDYFDGIKRNFWK